MTFQDREGTITLQRTQCNAYFRGFLKSRARAERSSGALLRRSLEDVHNAGWGPFRWPHLPNLTPFRLGKLPRASTPTPRDPCEPRSGSSRSYDSQASRELLHALALFLHSTTPPADLYTGSPGPGNGLPAMSDSQDAPLIQRHDDCDAEDDDVETRKLAEARPGLFVWVLTLSAGISGLLFGC